MNSPTTAVGPEGLDLSNDEPVPGLDEIIAILALGLARALEQARQPCPVDKCKSVSPK
jgi:hydrogenase/urease accessory protein HupE